MEAKIRLWDSLYCPSKTVTLEDGDENKHYVVKFPEERPSGNHLNVTLSFLKQEHGIGLLNKTFQ